MPLSKADRSCSHDLNIRSLLAYARGIDRLTGEPAAKLRKDALRRVNEMTLSGLPPLTRFTLSDGAKLPFRRFEGKESPAVIVLVHGSAGFGDQFADLARDLASHGVAEVYTLDLRGHGAWKGPRGRSVAHAGQLLDDLAEFIAFAKSRRPGVPIFLGGHSAGGGLALAMSSHSAADAISGYVLLAPYLGLQSPANRPHFGGWLKVSKFRLHLLGALNMAGLRFLNQMPVVRFDLSGAADPRYCQRWSLNTMLAFGPGAFAGELRTPSQTPVLLIAGDRDDCFDPSRYPEAIAPIAPHAEIVSAGPVGHWDLLVEPTTAAVIAKWLAEQGLTNLLRVAPRARRAAKRSRKKAS